MNKGILCVNDKAIEGTMPEVMTLIHHFMAQGRILGIDDTPNGIREYTLEHPDFIPGDHRYTLSFIQQFNADSTKPPIVMINGLDMETSKGRKRVKE